MSAWQVCQEHPLISLLLCLLGLGGNKAQGKVQEGPGRYVCSKPWLGTELKNHTHDTVTRSVGLNSSGKQKQVITITPLTGQFGHHRRQSFGDQTPHQREGAPCALGEGGIADTEDILASFVSSPTGTRHAPHEASRAEFRGLKRKWVGAVFY